MKNMAKALKALTIGITPFVGVIILLMAALAFTACPTGDGSTGGGSNVTEADILGVDIPEVGATPVKGPIDRSQQYTATVSWLPDDNTFQPNTVYKAIIDLHPKGSFDLQGVEANYFKVNGAVTTNNRNSGLVTAVFDPTGSPDGAFSPITKTHIDDVYKPRPGGIAVKAVDNNQYSGTVTWQPDPGDTFASGVEYSVTVNLEAKRGWGFPSTASNYTVGGQAANFVNVGRGQATVTTDFPRTEDGAQTISNPRITLAGLPETGKVAKEVTVRTNLEYTADILWETGVGTGPNINGVDFKGRFLAESTPTATISIKPIPGVSKIEGVPANFFYIEGYVDEDGQPLTTVVTNEADSTILKVTIPAAYALAKTVTAKSILGFKVPITDEVSSVTVNNYEQYKGTIVWTPQPETTSRKFQAGKKYDAEITMEPRKGWTFFGINKNFFTLDGANTVENEESSGVVTATFPTTAGTNVTIDGYAIYLDGYTQGALARKVRVRVNRHRAVDGSLDPNGTIVDQYEQDPPGDATVDAVDNVVRFDPNPIDGTFVPGQAYTAYFAVKARPGFTLEGVPANSFKVNDKQAQHDAGSGILTVHLGEVGKLAVGTLENRHIRGLFKPAKDIDLPKANSKVVGSVVSGIFQPDGDIVWVPALLSTNSANSAGKFAPNTSYTAKIKLKSDQYDLDNWGNMRAEDIRAFFVHSLANNSDGWSYFTDENGAEDDTITNNIRYEVKDGGVLKATTTDSPNPSYDKDNYTISLTFIKTAPKYLSTDSELRIPLAPPVTKKTPQRTITHPDNAFTGYAVWYKKDGDILVTGNFEPNTAYYATIELRPVEDGWYVLNKTDHFTVDGGTVDVESIVETGTEGRLMVKASFPPTRAILPDTITLDSLPVTGALRLPGVNFDYRNNPLPNTGLIFGTVVWTGPAGTSIYAGRFGSEADYEASITIRPDTSTTTGYSLRGINPTGYFKIKNSDVVPTYTLPDDLDDVTKLTIKVTFPKTAKSIASLSGVDLTAAKAVPGDFHPRTGATVKKIGSGDAPITGPYYDVVGLSWAKTTLGTNYGDNNFEKTSQTYIAKVTIKPKAGYSFYGVNTAAWFTLATGKKSSTIGYGNWASGTNPICTNANAGVDATDPFLGTLDITFTYAPIPATVTKKIMQDFVEDQGEAATPSDLNSAAGSQYTVNTLTWTPALTGGRFAANMTYVAKYAITLTTPANTFDGLITGKADGSIPDAKAFFGAEAYYAEGSTTDGKKYNFEVGYSTKGVGTAAKPGEITPGRITIGNFTPGLHFNDVTFEHYGTLNSTNTVVWTSGNTFADPVSGNDEILESMPYQATISLVVKSANWIFDGAEGDAVTTINIDEELFPFANLVFPSPVVGHNSESVDDIVIKFPGVISNGELSLPTAPASGDISLPVINFGLSGTNLGTVTWYKWNATTGWVMVGNPGNPGTIAAIVAGDKFKATFSLTSADATVYIFSSTVPDFTVPASATPNDVTVTINLAGASVNDRVVVEGVGVVFEILQ